MKTAGDRAARSKSSFFLILLSFRWVLSWTDGVMGVATLVTKDKKHVSATEAKQEALPKNN
jgi:hypothetical protein